MARISRGAALGAAASAVGVGVAMAASGGWGPFGPDRPLDPGACYFIYTVLVQLVLFYLVICTQRCDDEDRECTIRCVHVFFYLLIIINLFLIVCLLGNLFS